MISTGELSGWLAALPDLAADVDDAERIDQLRLLEELKSAAAAAQAVVTAAFARSQRAANGVPTGGDPAETESDAVLHRPDPADPVAAGPDPVDPVADVSDPADPVAAGPDPADPVAAVSRCAAERAQRRRRAAQAARSICGQVALARKEAPRCGGTHVGLAEVLVYEMPRTLAALARGTISEWRATLICRETAGLSREHRGVVDAELDGQLAGAGDRRVAQLARAAAYRLDPDAVMARAARATSDRRVTIRPAPDTMSYISLLLPVEAGVAVYAELRGAADAAVAAGDGRSRGQLMADFAVDRILHPGAGADSRSGSTADLRTGASARPGIGGDRVPDAPSPDDPVAAVRAAYAAANAGTQRSPGPPGAVCTPNPVSSPPGPARSVPAPPPPGRRATPPPAVGVPPGVNLEIGLIVTDRALFGDDDEPALLDGEVIPAGLARALVSDLPKRSKVWIRRLYTRPRTGQLLGMDSRRRLFDDNLRRFVLLRDQRCRTPWCDAPIRHADHVRPAARGGPTAACNADGLSEDCNYTREAPGWHASVDRRTTAGRLTVTTPTGHRYTSDPPALHRPRSHHDRRTRTA